MKDRGAVSSLTNTLFKRPLLLTNIKSFALKHQHKKYLPHISSHHLVNSSLEIVDLMGAWEVRGCFHTGNATAVIVYREKYVSKHISPQRYILSFY